MNCDALRLARLPLSAKLLVTLLLLIIGPGYLASTANIYFKHREADGEPELTIEDLKATFHGIQKQFQPEDKVTVNSHMLTQVRPGGGMREHLEEGGEAAIRALVTWLERAAKEEEFTTAGLAQPGDPSAQAVIKAHCIECHNAEDGEIKEIPYAQTATSEPEYAKVMVVADPQITREPSGVQTQTIKPISVPRLVQVTHVHVMTIPIFTFVVGVLFLMTGLPPAVKLLLGPLPMLAVLLDISGWWIARFVESYVYVIGAAGALHGATYALQILCVLGSVWLGKRAEVH